ncbi:MAG: hypothetical protein LLG06_13650 [Desulfobacteraceae bacterium]|nr:hypothetical protein [Desulfobacteraceae bacterium]
MVIALIGGAWLGFSEADLPMVVFSIAMLAIWNVATRMFLPRTILTGNPSGYVVYRYYRAANNTLTENCWLRYLLRTVFMTVCMSGTAFLAVRIYRLHW